MIQHLVDIEVQKLVGKVMCPFSYHSSKWESDSKNGNFYRIMEAKTIMLGALQVQVRLKLNNTTYQWCTGTPIFSTKTGFSLQIESCYIIEPTELVKLKLGAI